MVRKIKVSDEQIIEASLNSNSATQASVMLGIKYDTYKVHATRLGVFKTNKSGIGINKLKKDGRGKISLTEILEGKHPSYQTNKLRLRLLSEKIKESKCEICGINDWLGKRIALELDHIDGKNYNHIYSNLRIVCPNCHAQTDTYRGKNKSGSGGTVYTPGLKPDAL